MDEKEKLHILHEVCELYFEALKEARDGLRDSRGSISAGDADYMDKLTHTLKSVKTTAAMMEAEGEEGGYSNRGMMPMYGGYAYDDGMGGNSRRGNSYEGNSYEGGNSYRSRGYSMRRDSMGRYSRDAGKDEFTRQLQELVDKAPNDRMRQQVERIIRETDQN